MNGCKLEAPMIIGEFGQAMGVTIPADPDGNTAGLFSVYPECKSTDSVLPALTVQAGVYSRYLVNKAQTADVSIFGGQFMMRVKANLANGVHAGLWAAYEQSGTVTTTYVEAAAICSVECATTLTATNLYGLVINSNAAAATITNFAAINVGGAGAKAFDYILDVSSGGAPVVAFARFTAVTSVINTTTTVSATQAGYILVKIGTVSKHIPLYTV
jgi:hypothetical protein